MAVSRNDRRNSRSNERYQRENRSPVRRRSPERLNRSNNRVEENRRKSIINESDLPPINREKVFKYIDG